MDFCWGEEVKLMNVLETFKGEMWCVGVPALQVAKGEKSGWFAN